MRLFAALLPPRAAVAELAAAVHVLRALPGADGLRWTHRADWHLTLAFYGEVAEPLLPELTERLARAALHGRPLGLRLAGAGQFGDRALWAGVGGATALDGDGGADSSLTRLAGAAATAGRRSGIEGVGGETADRPERRFRAHLTLARASRSSVPPGGLAPYVGALDGFFGEPWTAGELVLLRSQLPASGAGEDEQPHYETLSAWPLGPA